VRIDPLHAIQDETGLSLAELRQPFFQSARSSPAGPATASSAGTARQPSAPVPSSAKIEPPATASPRVDRPHAKATLPPHFDVQTVLQHSPPKKTNWVALAGQLLAYAGVALLTVGASMVLHGYFSGSSDYTPTGWLVTTAGQMLLFLGVITLVSGGMEQTSEDVTRRVDMLGEHILRIEQATRGHGLRGPTVPPERFANTETTATQTRGNEPRTRVD
jgi:hypothetical protein